MRVEPFTIGSYVHVVKRGARGMEIAREESDRRRFLKMLYLLNDKHFDKDWYFNKEAKGLYERPAHWPPREPVVEVSAFTLMPNHFHLILREIVDGGVSLFMKRLGQSLTKYYNEKYEEKGSIFQGSYRSKTIHDDTYLRYVAAYVLVKNVFELYPYGGLSSATKDFDSAWVWACAYNYSSLKSLFTKNEGSPIVSNDILEELFDSESFYSFSKDMILGGRWAEEESTFE